MSDIRCKTQNSTRLIFSWWYRGTGLSIDNLSHPSLAVGLHRMKRSSFLYTVLWPMTAYCRRPYLISPLPNNKWTDRPIKYKTKTSNVTRAFSMYSHYLNGEFSGVSRHLLSSHATSPVEIFVEVKSLTFCHCSARKITSTYYTNFVFLPEFSSVRGACIFRS